MIVVRTSMSGFGLAAGTLMMPTNAWAHSGNVPNVHFLNGFLHPLSGLDHVLAMMAAGLFAASLGGRALWSVPLTFLTFMVLGCRIGLERIALPLLEPAIALSLTGLGVAIVTRKHWTRPAAIALAGTFALFHGYAHGLEMPHSNAATLYALGFVTASALLQSAGMAIALVGNRMHFPGHIQTVTLAGIVFSSAGLGLFLHAF